MELKVIGAGATGCVFSPGLTCKATIDPDPNIVTKVMESYQEWLNEGNEFDAVTRADPTGRFTVAAIEKCMIGFSSFPADIRRALKDKCWRLLGRLERHNIVFMFRLPNGGDNLTNFTQERRIPDMLAFLSGAAGIFQWLKIAQHMNRDSLVGHLDIKGDNILVRESLDTGQYQWRLIDFGLSRSFHSWAASGTAAKYFPLDYDAYASVGRSFEVPEEHYSWMRSLLMGDVEDTKLAMVPSDTVRALLSLIPTEDQTRKAFLAMKERLSNNSIVTDAATKVDVFMFGKTLLTTMLSMVRVREDGPPSDEALWTAYEFIRQVVLPMMAVNVFQRVDAIVAASIYEIYMGRMGYTVSTGDALGRDIVPPPPDKGPWVGTAFPADAPRGAFDATLGEGYGIQVTEDAQSLADFMVAVATGSGDELLTSPYTDIVSQWAIREPRQFHDALLIVPPLIQRDMFVRFPGTLPLFSTSELSQFVITALTDAQHERDRDVLNVIYGFVRLAMASRPDIHSSQVSELLARLTTGGRRRRRTTWRHKTPQKMKKSSRRRRRK